MIVAASPGERLLEIVAAQKSGDVEALVHHLHDPDYRDVAARGLGRLGAEEAVPAVVCLLSDRDPKSRLAATIALGRIGSPEASDALIRTMERDDDEVIRGSAASALGRIREVRAVPALITQLNDPSQAVRISAVEALGAIGNPSALEPLREARGGERWLIRRQIRRAIRSISKGSE